MGGQSSTTPQIGASPMGAQAPMPNPMGGMPPMPAPMPNPMAANMPLAAMFMGNSGYGGGYQQTPIPQIQAPQYPTATWTPQQAQAQTVAQMNALRPYVPPPAPAAPQKDPWVHSGGANR